MLGENIKMMRKAKGLSQEELAVKLSVVRQTVSKWECGLSVPDADLLVRLSEELEVPVGALLGEVVVGVEAMSEEGPMDLRSICEKLEVINLQLARRSACRRRFLLCAFAATFLVVVLMMMCLGLVGGEYLSWDYKDPEMAFAATALHAFEWLFVRFSPLLLLGSAAGFCLVWKRDAAGW